MESFQLSYLNQPRLPAGFQLFSCTRFIKDMQLCNHTVITVNHKQISYKEIISYMKNENVRFVLIIVLAQLRLIEWYSTEHLEKYYYYYYIHITMVNFLAMVVQVILLKVRIRFYIIYYTNIAIIMKQTYSIRNK